MVAATDCNNMVLPCLHRATTLIRYLYLVSSRYLSRFLCLSPWSKTLEPRCFAIRPRCLFFPNHLQITYRARNCQQVVFRYSLYFFWVEVHSLNAFERILWVIKEPEIDFINTSLRATLLCHFAPMTYLFW